MKGKIILSIDEGVSDEPATYCVMRDFEVLYLGNDLDQVRFYNYDTVIVGRRYSQEEITQLLKGEQ